MRTGNRSIFAHLGMLILIAMIMFSAPSLAPSTAIAGDSGGVLFPMTPPDSTTACTTTTTEPTEMDLMFIALLGLTQAGI